MAWNIASSITYLATRESSRLLSQSAQCLIFFCRNKKRAIIWKKTPPCQIAD